MKIKPNSKTNVKIPAECFYRNKRRRVYDPHDLHKTGYCYCNFSFGVNPNAHLLEFPKIPGQRCHCISTNQRYKLKLKKAKKLDAARRNAILASISSANAASFVPDCSSSMADVNEKTTTIQDEYFDNNDNIDCNKMV